MALAGREWEMLLKTDPDPEAESDRAPSEYFNQYTS